MSEKSKLGIMFIHGAGLNGQIWHEVIKHLNCPYKAADYSTLQQSMGPRARLSDYVSLAYDQAVAIDADKVIIVAHSIGGIVGIEALKKLSDRAAGFVGISAAIPEPKNNFVSLLPFPQKLLMPIILKLIGTKPPVAAMRKGLCSDLNEDQTKKIIASYTPESVWLYLDKISNTSIKHVPTFYIRTLQDKEFSIELQNTMIEGLPGVNVYDIDSGHMPMLSQPRLVIKHINRVLEVLS